MKIEVFELERIQSLYENVVEVNLTESGIHPYTLQELLSREEIEEILQIRIGYGQTNGSIALRNAISRLYPGTSRSNILVTNGSAQANFITLWSMMEPGDELVLMLPNYMQILGLANSFGIRVVPIYLKEELAWAPDFEQLARAIGPKTKMIALCNPNNPTGAVLTPAAMSAIISMAREVNAWLYCDEIYRGAELSSAETASFYSAYEKVIVNGGLSKAYGLPGLRIGWLVGPEKIIEKAWSYNDYLTISTSILNQKIAGFVLRPHMRGKILQRNRDMLKVNIKIINQWVLSHPGLFSYVPPRAGGMAFIKYNLAIKSRKLADRLRMEKGVFVMDGDCFGIDKYIRIGFGAEKGYLQRGLSLIDEFLKQL